MRKLIGILTLLILCIVPVLLLADNVTIWDSAADELLVNDDGSIDVVISSNTTAYKNAMDAYNATQWMPVYHDGNIVTFNLSYDTNTSHFWPPIDAYVYYKGE